MITIKKSKILVQVYSSEIGNSSSILFESMSFLDEMRAYYKYVYWKATKKEWKYVFIDVILKRLEMKEKKIRIKIFEAFHLNCDWKKQRRRMEKPLLRMKKSQTETM